MAKRKAWTITPCTGNANQGIDRQAMLESLHDSLIAVGLVQTEDIGQMEDFTSAANDFVSISTLGYRIYKLPFSIDTVFLKISFKVYATSSSTGVDILSFDLSIGTGTDGNGNLAGLVSTVTSYPEKTISSTPVVCYGDSVPRSSFAFCDDAMLWVAFGCSGFPIGNTGSGTTVGGGTTTRNMPILFFCISRVVGNDGTPESGAIVLLVPPPPDVGSNAFGYSYSYDPKMIVLDTSVGIVRTAVDFLNKPDPLAGGSALGQLVVGTLNCVQGGHLRQIYGVGSVACLAAASGDTIEVILYGLEPISLFVPDTNIQGFAGLSYKGGDTSVNLKFDTPALLWEGEFV